MRRVIAVWTMVLGLLLVSLGIAGAESTTVDGTSDITRMYASNGQSSVLVKVYGTGGKDEIRWVNVTMKGKDGVRYKAQGANYPGGEWATSLEKGQKAVDCPGLRVAWKADGGFWRFLVPRSCLTKLTQKIRVSAVLVSNASAVPGEAGPTRWLARG